MNPSNPEFIERKGNNFETVLERKKIPRGKYSMVRYPAVQSCLEGELLPLFLNGTIQRAFRAIKSHLWQSWRMISLQKSCNVKVCAVDLELV